MSTQLLFAALVAALAIQRIYELGLSRRNEKLMLAKGGREHASQHYPVMKAVHTAWFISALAEVVLFNRPFIPILSLVALLLLAAGQALRYAAIKTLGWRWSVRIVTIPDSPAVQLGIYRYLKHPNYMGVALEILAMPLLHSAYITAIIFSIANGLILKVRIQAEEQALAENNHYEEAFEHMPRFIPKIRERI